MGSPAAFGWLVDKVLGPLVAGLAIAGFGGWWLARLNEHYRGQREHLTKSVDYLRDQISGLMSLSSMYWVKTDPEHDAANEAEIEFRLEQISSLMRVCATDLWGDAESEGPALVGKLTAAIVTEGYATPNRTADLTRPMAIAHAAGEVVDAVLSLRRSFFNERPKMKL